MSQTPNLGVQLLATNTVQKEVVINEGFVTFDALIARSAKSRTNTPPSAPADGDTYIIGAAPTGEWQTHANAIAFYFNGWRYVTPPQKTKFFLRDVSAWWTYSGTGWVADPVTSVSTLDDLSNVDVASPADKAILQYDATSNSWKPVTVPVQVKVSQLTDVDLTGLANGKMLAWNATTSKWEAVSPPTGGSGASALNELTDVDPSNRQDSASLVWDNTKGKAIWRKIVVPDTPSLSSLPDVVTRNAQANDVLAYNGSAWGPSPAVITYSFLGMVDGPRSFSGAANKFLVVDDTESFMTFKGVSDLFKASDFKLQNLADVTAPTDANVGKVLQLTKSAGKYSYTYATFDTWAVALKNGTTTVTDRLRELKFTGFAVTEGDDGYVTVAARNVLTFKADGTPVDGPDVSAINFTGDGVGVTNTSGTLVVTIDREGGSLAGLSDVDATTAPGNGQVLIFDELAHKWKPGTPFATSRLDKLEDVDLRSSIPADGQALVYTQSDGKWRPGTVNASTQLSKLTDVDLTTTAPAAGNLLTYDGTAKKWKPATAPSGLPTGGTTGQVLKKASNTNGDVTWGAAPVSLPLGGTTGQFLRKASNTDGDAAWTSFTGGLPAGGQLGQVLMKSTSADGAAEWVDAPMISGGLGVNSKQWRILISQTASGGGWASIRELAFCKDANGVNQCVGGTASASSYGNSDVAANAFDGTLSRWTSGTSNRPNWLQYTFTDPVFVNHVIMTVDVAGDAPTEFDVQYFDGTQWVTQFHVSTPSTWTIGETRAFTYKNPGSYGLGNLANVDLTTPPTNGQALVYDATAKKWKAGTVASSGGASLPAGGTVGQVLTKTGAADGAADWRDPAAGTSSSGSTGSNDPFTPGVPDFGYFTPVATAYTTAQQSNRAIIVSSTATSRKIFYRQAPAAPYRIAVALTAGTSGNTVFAGFHSPVNNKHVLIRADRSNTNFYLQKFVNGSYSGDLATTGFFDRSPTVWLGLRDDGTTIFYEYSSDGITFTTLASETKASGHLSGDYQPCWGMDGDNGHIVTLRCWDEKGLSRTFTSTGSALSALSGLEAMDLGLATGWAASTSGSATKGNVVTPIESVTVTALVPTLQGISGDQFRGSIVVLAADNSVSSVVATTSTVTLTAALNGALVLPFTTPVPMTPGVKYGLLITLAGVPGTTACKLGNPSNNIFRFVNAPFSMLGYSSATATIAAGAATSTTLTNDSGYVIGLKYRLSTTALPSLEVPLTAPPVAATWIKQNFDATKTKLVDFGRPVPGVRLYEDPYPYGNTNLLRAALVPVPGTKFDVKARLRRHTRVASFMSYGLVLREASTGKSQIIGFNYEAGGLGIVLLTNDTTYNDFRSLGGNQMPHQFDIWMRLRWDGTNAVFYLSLDGEWWRPAKTWTDTTWGFFTTAPSHIGFGYNANNANGSDIGQELDLLSWEASVLP